MLFSYCYSDRTWLLHSQCSDLFVTDLYGGALYLPTDSQIFYVLKRVQGVLSAEALLLRHSFPMVEKEAA